MARQYLIQELGPAGCAQRLNNLGPEEQTTHFSLTARIGTDVMIIGPTGAGLVSAIPQSGLATLLDWGLPGQTAKELRLQALVGRRQQ